MYKAVTTKYSEHVSLTRLGIKLVSNRLFVQLDRSRLLIISKLFVSKEMK